jgi:hypothetical protein
MRGPCLTCDGPQPTEVPLCNEDAGDERAWSHRLSVFKGHRESEIGSSLGQTYTSKILCGGREFK